MNIINGLKNSVELLVFFLFVVSCNPGRDAENNTSDESDSGLLTYANHLKINNTGNGYAIEVKNPWQNAEDISFSYQLTRKAEKHPVNSINAITIPVTRIVCLSTTHVGFISELNLQHTIVGLSGTRFVYDSIVNQRIEQGEVYEVGYEENLNYERIVALNPDVVIAYSITKNNSKQLENLKNLGIPVIYNAEYLEDNPLGKAEWITFFGALFDKMDTSLAIFQHIEDQYTKLLELTRNLTQKPRVLTGLPYKDIWYVPNSNSHLAQMIEQAGGQYLWEGYDDKEVYPLDLEAVYSKAGLADIWINTGFAASKKAIVTVDSRIGDFPVYKHGQVYNNNRRIGPSGGNDYFESGAVNPHLIVKDLIKIFHPEVLPDHSFFYYQSLK